MKRLSSTETIVLAVVETDTNIDRIAYVIDSDYAENEIDSIKADIHRHYPSCLLTELLMIDPITQCEMSLM